jgi:hypothetical protein
LHFKPLICLRHINNPSTIEIQAALESLNDACHFILLHGAIDLNFATLNSTTNVQRKALSTKMPWLQTQVYGGFTEQMSQEDKSRADDLTINVWPTTTDCVDWSQDAEVVISAGDDLQLLVSTITSERSHFAN